MHAFNIIVVVVLSLCCCCAVLYLLCCCCVVVVIVVVYVFVYNADAPTLKTGSFLYRAWCFEIWSVFGLCDIRRWCSIIFLFSSCAFVHCFVCVLCDYISYYLLWRGCIRVHWRILNRSYGKKCIWEASFRFRCWLGLKPIAMMTMSVSCIAEVSQLFLPVAWFCIILNLRTLRWIGANSQIKSIFRLFCRYEVNYTMNRVRIPKLQIRVIVLKKSMQCNSIRVDNKKWSKKIDFWVSCQIFYY